MNDEAAPASGTFEFDISTLRIAESTGTWQMTVNRNNGSDGDANVTLMSKDGSAIAGSDYEGISQVLAFAAGQTSIDLTLTLLDDLEYEGDEAFELELINAVGASLGNNSQATVTIVDDELPPVAGVLQFSGANYRADEGTGYLTITVLRSGGSTGTVSVELVTTDDSAISGSDYDALSIVLILPAGQITATTDLLIHDDALYEGDETLNLRLTNIVGDAVLGQVSSSAVTIVDNDPVSSSGVVRFSGAAYTSAENAGSVTITVIRSDGSYGDISVDYFTTDGTATAGQDYAETTGTLFMSDQQNSATLEIQILNDESSEPSETFSIGLTNPGNTSIGSIAESVVTIQDDDVSPAPTPPSGGSSGGGGAVSWLLLILGGGLLRWRGRSYYLEWVALVSSRLDLDLISGRVHLSHK